MDFLFFLFVENVTKCVKRMNQIVFVKKTNALQMTKNGSLNICCIKMYQFIKIQVNLNFVFVFVFVCELAELCVKRIIKLNTSFGHEKRRKNQCTNGTE